MASNQQPSNARYTEFAYNSSIHDTIPSLATDNKSFLNLNFEPAYDGIRMVKRKGMDKLFPEADYSIPPFQDKINGTEILLSREVITLQGNFLGNPTRVVNNFDFNVVISVWAYKKTGDANNIYSLGFSINRGDKKIFLDYTSISSNKIEDIYANRRSVEVEKVGTTYTATEASFYISINIEGTTLNSVENSILFIAQPLIRINVTDYFNNTFTAELYKDASNNDRFVNTSSLNTSNPTVNPIKLFYSSGRAFAVNGIRDSQQTFPNNGLPVSFWKSTLDLASKPEGNFFLKDDNTILFTTESNETTFLITDKRFYAVTIGSSGQDIDVKEIANNILSLKDGQISIGNELFTVCHDGIYKLNMRQQIITQEDVDSRISDSVFGLIKNLSPIKSFFNAGNSTVNFVFKIRSDKGILADLFSSFEDNNYVDIVLSRKIKLNKKTDSEQWTISTYEGNIFDVESVPITGALDSVARADYGIRVTDYEFQNELVVCTEGDCFISNKDTLTDFVSSGDKKPYQILYSINIPQKESMYAFSGRKRCNFVSLKIYVEVEESFQNSSSKQFQGAAYVIENKDGIESGTILEKIIISDSNYVSDSIKQGLITLDINRANPNSVVTICLPSNYIKSVIGHACVVKNTKN